MSETELPGVDSTTPNAARIYNYFLGGQDNFAADLFEGLELVEPGLVGVGQWHGTAGEGTSWWLGGVARKP
ncbi:SAM-dependent methyltransferase [Nonomuraea rubra]|uniref:SAM-dependent methyltransferase n=1 Tax=Nonomuraea rubra TaxID=46180 RepID=UPI0033FA97A5